MERPDAEKYRVISRRIGRRVRALLSKAGFDRARFMLPEDMIGSFNVLDKINAGKTDLCHATHRWNFHFRRN